MAEYGKLIKVSFDKDLSYRSIAENEEHFTVSSVEKQFVPGGENVATEYTVIAIEGDIIKAQKTDFLDGNETDVSIKVDIMQLSGSEGTPGAAGYTTVNTSYDNGYNRGQFFTVSNQFYIFKSVDVWSEEAEEVTIYLHKLAETGYVLNAGTRIATFTKTVMANIYDTIDISTVLAPGRYWLGIEVTQAYDLRYVTSPTYPQTYGDVSVLGALTYGGSALDTTSWWLYVNMTFATFTYYTAGEWTYPIDCNTINSVSTSIIRWEEDIPVDTSLIIYTAVNTSNTVEPTEWIEQSINDTVAASLTSGEDLTGKYLWIKITLSTTNTEATPTVSNPLFKVIKTLDAKAVILQIDGWAGFNKATEGIRVQYDGLSGSLFGIPTGYGPVASFDDTFTPTALLPINNPGDVEAIETSLTDYSLTRTLITFLYGYDNEALEVGLTNYTITRINIDDLPP